MADFSVLIASIRAQIRANGRQLITGPVMQASLLEIIDAVNAAKQDTLTFDSAPTEDSENPVTSGGVWRITSELTNSLEDLSVGVQEGYDDLLGRIEGKQDIIADLADIRAGALLGSTAYQKPADGIPFDDLTHSVQVSLESADQALKPNPAYDGQIPVYNEDGYINGSGITPADVVSKADQDGTYPDLTAGAVLADAIPAEFLLRTSPATQDGKAVLDTIKGKTLVWNQLAETNGPLSLTASSSLNYFGAVGSLTQRVEIPAGHRYLLSLDIVRSIAENDGISFGLAASVTPAAIANGAIDGRVAVIAVANSAISSISIYYNNYSGKRGLSAGDSIELSDIVIVDLTKMYGAGYEPSTVEEFQAMYPDVSYTYNAGQLINNAAEGIKTTSSSGAESVKALPIATYFPDGMNAIGAVCDELTKDNAVQRFGVRGYQAGDESDPAVLTDGTKTIYELATPLETAIADPLDLTFTAYEGGVEEVVSGEIIAPFCASIRYPASPEGLTIVDLLTALKAAGVISDFAVTVDAGTSKKAITINA